MTMKYDDPACAYCPPKLRACRQGESAERGPGFCPTKVDPEVQASARAVYEEPQTRKLSREAAVVEVGRLLPLDPRRGDRAIRQAHGLSQDRHRQLHQLRRSRPCAERHPREPRLRGGLGGVQDRQHSQGGNRLADHEKIRPGQFEPLCNPVCQAQLLNAHGCEFNVVMGLCVGHDSLFFRHIEGLATVLVAKDRVLGHNPIAALNLADSYYSRVWGPLKADRAAQAAGGRPAAASRRRRLHAPRMPACYAGAHATPGLAAQPGSRARRGRRFRAGRSSAARPLTRAAFLPRVRSCRWSGWAAGSPSTSATIRRHARNAPR